MIFRRLSTQPLGAYVASSDPRLLAWLRSNVLDAVQLQTLDRLQNAAALNLPIDVFAWRKLVTALLFAPDLMKSLRVNTTDLTLILAKQPQDLPAALRAGAVLAKPIAVVDQAFMRSALRRHLINVAEALGDDATSKVSVATTAVLARQALVQAMLASAPQLQVPDQIEFCVPGGYERLRVMAYLLRYALNLNNGPLLAEAAATDLRRYVKPENLQGDFALALQMLLDETCKTGVIAADPAVPGTFKIVDDLQLTLQWVLMVLSINTNSKLVPKVRSSTMQGITAFARDLAKAMEEQGRVQGEGEGPAAPPWAERLGALWGPESLALLRWIGEHADRLPEDVRREVGLLSAASQAVLVEKQVNVDGSEHVSASPSTSAIKVEAGSADSVTTAQLQEFFRTLDLAAVQAVIEGNHFARVLVFKHLVLLGNALTNALVWPMIKDVVRYDRGVITAMFWNPLLKPGLFTVEAAGIGGNSARSYALADPTALWSYLPRILPTAFLVLPNVKPKAALVAEVAAPRVSAATAPIAGAAATASVAVVVPPSLAGSSDDATRRLKAALKIKMISETGIVQAEARIRVLQLALAQRDLDLPKKTLLAAIGSVDEDETVAERTHRYLTFWHMRNCLYRDQKTGTYKVRFPEISNDALLILRQEIERVRAELLTKSVKPESGLVPVAATGFAALAALQSASVADPAPKGSISPLELRIRRAYARWPNVIVLLLSKVSDLADSADALEEVRQTRFQCLENLLKDADFFTALPTMPGKKLIDLLGRKEDYIESQLRALVAKNLKKSELAPKLALAAYSEGSDLEAWVRGLLK